MTKCAIGWIIGTLITLLRIPFLRPNRHYKASTGISSVLLIEFSELKIMILYSKYVMVKFCFEYQVFVWRVICEKI